MQPTHGPPRHLRALLDEHLDEILHWQAPLYPLCPQSARPMHSPRQSGPATCRYLASSTTLTHYSAPLLTLPRGCPERADGGRRLRIYLLLRPHRPAFDRQRNQSAETHHSPFPGPTLNHILLEPSRYWGQAPSHQAHRLMPMTHPAQLRRCPRVHPP